MMWVLTVVLLVVLVGASAFFSSSETALLSISKIHLRQMVKDRMPGAKRVSALKSDMDRLLTTILIGNNFVNNLASSAATALAVDLFGQGGVGAATVAMTIIIIMFGEVLPKTLATMRPDHLACRASLPLMVLQKVMFPLVWLFACLTRGVGSFVDKVWRSDTPLVTEDELKTLIALGNAEGTLENNEKDMLYKIFEFTDLRVRDIARHRSFVQGIPSDASYQEAVAIFNKCGYSRIPVYDSVSGQEGDKDAYVGLLHYKTMLFYQGNREEKDFARRHMKEILYVPETKLAVSLLHTFKTDRTSFAAVVDEHGTTSGVVTLDDILNAVMGRMTDEYSREVAPEKRIRILSSTDFLLPGDLKLSDVNEIFSLHCESDDFDTLGGWLLERFGYLPSTGEVYRDGERIFVVEDQAQRRIKTVRLKIKAAVRKQRVPVSGDSETGRR
ncbi:MAG: HlyC/CorC family transporter [Spirochaetaceae bacterium]|nr:HlyC/CorC family transporter [Spirochaetaceae bacterium]